MSSTASTASPISPTRSHSSESVLVGDVAQYAFPKITFVDASFHGTTDFGVPLVRVGRGFIIQVQHSNLNEVKIGVALCHSRGTAVLATGDGYFRMCGHRNCQVCTFKVSGGSASLKIELSDECRKLLKSGTRQGEDMFMLRVFDLFDATTYAFSPAFKLTSKGRRRVNSKSLKALLAESREIGDFNAKMISGLWNMDRIIKRELGQIKDMLEGSL